MSLSEDSVSLAGPSGAPLFMALVFGAPVAVVAAVAVFLNWGR